MNEASIHIGTSGWHYSHWRGTFYPPDLRTEDWLAYYAERFQTVEINNSFYRLPQAETFDHWRENSPAGFLFAVKASRYITHMKKLTDPQASAQMFFERALRLEEKLGPVLFQLPPHWRANEERLEAFLQSLPGGPRYTFEFRDASWLNEGVYSILRRHNAALCLYDFNRRTTPLERTADFVYIRLHGPGGPYQDRYTGQALAEWASAIRRWQAEGCSVYCYFDNDMAGFAPANAAELQQMFTSTME